MHDMIIEMRSRFMNHDSFTDSSCFLCVLFLLKYYFCEIIFLYTNILLLFMETLKEIKTLWVGWLWVQNEWSTKFCLTVQWVLIDINKGNTVLYSHKSEWSQMWGLRGNDLGLKLLVVIYEMISFSVFIFQIHGFFHHIMRHWLDLNCHKVWVNE